MQRPTARQWAIIAKVFAEMVVIPVAIYALRLLDNTSDLTEEEIELSDLLRGKR